MALSHDEETTLVQRLGALWRLLKRYPNLGMPVVEVEEGESFVDIIVHAFEVSKSEARRLMTAGAIVLNEGEMLTDPKRKVAFGDDGDLYSIAGIPYPLAFVSKGIGKRVLVIGINK